MKTEGMGYCSVERQFQAEIVVQKSRFIGILQPVETPQAVTAALESIRKQYPDATHHCYAYRLGPQGQPYGFSDDREPSGTAGKPIYMVLEKYQLSDVLLVVVRYFGGIKLGTGGLARAYRQAAEHVVQAATIVEKVKQRMVVVEVDYELSPVVQHYLHQHQLPFEAQYDASIVTLTLSVPEPQLPSVESALQQLMRGKGEVKRLESEATHSERRY